MKNRKPRASASLETSQTGSEADGSQGVYPPVSKTCDYQSRPGPLPPFRGKGGRKRKETHQLVGITIEQLRRSYYTQATLWPISELEQLDKH